MWRVRLETADCEVVEHVLVLRYKRMPEVLLFGHRVFQRCQQGVYREVFATLAWSEEDMVAMGLLHGIEVDIYTG